MTTLFRLPLVLLAGLALAACETTGSTQAPPATATAGAGAAAPAGRPPTQSVRGQVSQADQAAWSEVIAAIAPQLNPCLQEVYTADASRRVGEIRAIAEYERDGTLRGMQVGNADRIQSDADYRAVVEALVQGVQRCSPLRNMPADKYDIWEFFPIVYRSQPA